MATIIIPIFKGMTPRTHERLLQPGQAQVATNCRLERGILEAVPGLGAAEGSSSGGTLFRHPDLGWKSFSAQANAIKSAVADSGGHYFVTGEGYPQQGTTALGGSMRRLGIPRPAAALEVQLTGDVFIPTTPATPTDPDDDDTEGGETEEPEVDVPDIERSSAYCYTYVVDMGAAGEQESAPSPPTGVFDVLEGQEVRLTGFVSPGMTGVNASKCRIYRAVGGLSTSSWFFLAEINMGLSSWTDGVSDNNISSETLRTADWDMPEDDARGIILTPNGIYAMHREREVLLSEPFVPYAYPQKYRLSVQDKIVGLGFIESTIVVLTTGRPFILMGTTPESMSVQPVAFEQACLSKRSIVSTPYGVMYASPDGLCAISSAGPQVVTRDVFTKEQWQALGPAQIMGAFHEEKYYAWLAGSGRCVVYDFTTRDVREIALSGMVSAAYHDSGTDNVYLAHNGSICPMERGSSRMDYTWRSAEVFLSFLAVPAVVRIEGGQSAANPVTLRLLADGTVRETASVTSTDPVRVRTWRAEKSWSLELSGTADVYELRAATSIEELEYGQ